MLPAGRYSTWPGADVTVLSSSEIAIPGSPGLRSARKRTVLPRGVVVEAAGVDHGRDQLIDPFAAGDQPLECRRAATSRRRVDRAAALTLGSAATELSSARVSATGRKPHRARNGSLSA